MRVALLTESGYPYATGATVAWYDHLVRALADHDVEICAFSRSPRQATGPLVAMPPNVRRVRTAALWGASQGAADHRLYADRRPDAHRHPPGEPCGRGRPGRADRKPVSECATPRWLDHRYGEAFAELASALCDPGAGGGLEGPLPGATGSPCVCSTPGPAVDRFATALYALADTAAGNGGLSSWLRSRAAVRALGAACRASDAPRAVRAANLVELETVCARLERLLRPLSLPWYGELSRSRRDPSQESEYDRGNDPGLAAVQLCHAFGTGAAALPGLLARRFHGVPLVVTSGIPGDSAPRSVDAARVIHPAQVIAPTAPSAPVRALLAVVRDRLTAVVRQAAAVETAGPRGIPLPPGPERAGPARSCSRASISPGRLPETGGAAPPHGLAAGTCAAVGSALPGHPSGGCA